jgi:hypothetical protein
MALTPREGLMELLACLRRVNMTDRAGLIQEFDGLSRIVETVSVRQLSVPRRYDRLDEVRRIVRQDLHQP